MPGREDSEAHWGWIACVQIETNPYQGYLVTAQTFARPRFSTVMPQLGKYTLWTRTRFDNWNNVSFWAQAQTKALKYASEMSPVSLVS